MILHTGLTNKECVGLEIVFHPDNYKKRMDEDGYLDVADNNGRIIYMMGEMVTIIGYDENKNTVKMRNENVDRDFEIDYEQYIKDFGNNWTFDTSFDMKKFA